MTGVEGNFMEIEGSRLRNTQLKYLGSMLWKVNEKNIKAITTLQKWMLLQKVLTFQHMM